MDKILRSVKWKANKNKNVDIFIEKKIGKPYKNIVYMSKSKRTVLLFSISLNSLACSFVCNKQA